MPELKPAISIHIIQTWYFSSGAIINLSPAVRIEFNHSQMIRTVITATEIVNQQIPLPISEQVEEYWFISRVKPFQFDNIIPVFKRFQQMRRNVRIIF